MAIPASGPLTLQDVQTEFGGTNPIGINEYYAGGGLVPAGTTGTNGAVPSSGTISIQNFYGTANLFSFNLTSGTDLNLRTQALAAGWDGARPLQATIPVSNTIQASSTGTYALTINGSFPSGVTLLNNGIIVGRGGNAGAGGNAVGTFTVNPAGNGTAAGPGLLVSVAVTIDNASGRIAGGGGGGGGGGSVYMNFGRGNTAGAGGGGGGGGIGVSSLGAGGTASGFANNAAGTAGTAGTVSANGTGGAGGVYNSGSQSITGGTGGVGGSYGSNGVAGAIGVVTGVVNTSAVGTVGAAGTAGACLAGNSNITWAGGTAFGQRDGAIT